MADMLGLDSKFPVVRGRLKLNAIWSVDLPGEFNRRVEDGDLVLWRPGITAFVAIWNNDNAESVAERFAWLRGDLNLAAFDLVEDTLGNCQRFAYRLLEGSDDSRVPALYAFTIAEDSHVQLAVYFDAEQDSQVALQLWRAVVPGER